MDHITSLANNAEAVRGTAPSSPQCSPWRLCTQIHKQPTYVSSTPYEQLGYRGQGRTAKEHRNPNSAIMSPNSGLPAAASVAPGTMPSGYGFACRSSSPYL